MRASRRLFVMVVASALVGPALALPPPSASARPADQPRPPAGTDRGGETLDLGPDLNDGKPLPRDPASFARSRRIAAAQTAPPRARTSPPAGSEVGTTKTWMALDTVTGQVYVKDYRLRGLGAHVQVWVADDRDFPAGDCRNALGLTQVTDAQVARFVTAFDSTIYPLESAAFSVPPSRDGSDAPLAAAIGRPADYYRVPAVEADDTVVLVDNVRDTNFFEPTSPDGQTYTAGFFSSVFNRYVDRNVMTVDAFDWEHRTGADPPTDADDPAYRDCSAALGLSGTRGLGVPRPQLYEGTFAHEYQHLLQSYLDPDEHLWVNEGLSDYAQTLVGYLDPTLPPEDPAADARIRSFLGFLGPSFGGPENSLTSWQDQGGPEVLSDYGAAYTMTTYLAGRYGPRALSLLHREPGNGLAGLDRVLEQLGARTTAQQALHDWAAAMALDAATAADDRWAPTGPFSVDTLQARVNWETAQAFDTPGAPPNGSDYVRFRDRAGRYLDSRALRRLRFDGSATLSPQPVQWTLDPTPPARSTDETTCGAVAAGPPGSSEAALHSGCGPDLDRAVARPVSVPAGGSPTLSFEALWDLEEGWDAGFVQVSDDGGRSWRSLPTEDTTSDVDPEARAAVAENVPGFTGGSGGWRRQHADLSAYAGRTVLVGFRLITDGSVDEAGWWVRDVAVGPTPVPTALEGWRSYSQVSPTPVHGFTVQLVGLGHRGGRVRYLELHLRDGLRASLSGRRLRDGLGRGSRLVGAIVTYDDPTEQVQQSARYELTVNGHLQPGG